MVDSPLADLVRDLNARCSAHTSRAYARNGERGCRCDTRRERRGGWRMCNLSVCAPQYPHLTHIKTHLLVVFRLAVVVHPDCQSIVTVVLPPFGYPLLTPLPLQEVPSGRSHSS